MMREERMTWGLRELVPVFFVALLLTAKWWKALIPGYDSSLYVSGMVGVVLQTAATVCVCFAYRDMLGGQWRTYKPRIWLKILLAVGCVAAMYAILWAARKLPFVVSATAAAGGSADAEQPAVWFAAVAALVPLQAPFLEEILFRHNLFFRFKKKTALAVIMCAVSAVLFGLVHFNNFGGNLLLTVPYMFIGLFLNALYFFTKNIWYTLVPHIVFNALGGILPALFMLILTAFGVNVG